MAQSVCPLLLGGSVESIHYQRHKLIETLRLIYLPVENAWLRLIILGQKVLGEEGDDTINLLQGFGDVVIPVCSALNPLDTAGKSRERFRPNFLWPIDL